MIFILITNPTMGQCFGAQPPIRVIDVELDAMIAECLSPIEVSDTEVEEEVARVMSEVNMEQRVRALGYVWPSVPTD